MSLSQTIKKVMMAKGISPTDVAKRTGYTPQYLHSLLDGNRRWNETTLTKACDALELEIKLVPIKSNKLSVAEEGGKHANSQH